MANAKRGLRAVRAIVDDTSFVAALPEVGGSVLLRVEAARAKARRAEELRAEAARMEAEALDDVAALCDFVESNWTADEIARAKRCG